MNLTELTSPIRLYWDIDQAGGLPVSEYGRVAEEVVANKFLSLQITDTTPGLCQSSKTVLDTLKEKPIALSMVAPIAGLDTNAMDLLKRSAVKVVFVQAVKPGDLSLVADIAKKAGGKPAIGVAFPVNRDNFHSLPEVLKSCIDHRIEHLLLPMQRLMTDEKCFSFSKKERTELAARLSAIEKPSWLKITIHDPFLWRAFFPKVEFPNGGCQAANTMLYISPDGDVYPCPTLPVKLGNLLTTPLKEVIRSTGKQELRKSILERPSACISCGDWAQCKGGCRGRACSMSRTMQEPDPSCA